MGLFNINCNNGKLLCDKNQYKEASLWEKIKLNFYLVVCSECRAYTSNNIKLTKTIKKKEVQNVSSSEKEILKQRLQEQLNAQK